MVYLSGFLFLLSLLAVFQAPAKALWFVAIGVTEWGHFLALLALGVAMASHSTSSARRLSRVLAFMAVLLFLTPLLRALPLARHLPEDMSRPFGPAEKPAKPL